MAIMPIQRPHNRKVCALLWAFSSLATPGLAAEVLESGQAYIAVQGGIQQAVNQKFSNASAAKVTIEMKEGFVVVGAIGRKAGPVRFEVEGSYRQNNADTHTTTSQLASPDGEAKVTAGMLNAYYDIPTSASIQPYVGAGVGVAHLQFDNYRAANTTQLDDNANAPAIQGIAGVMMPLKGPVSLNAEYRYFATADVRVESGTTQSDTSYKTHNFMVGARYAF